jgi:hypothetical protein
VLGADCSITVHLREDGVERVFSHITSHEELSRILMVLGESLRREIEQR